MKILRAKFEEVKDVELKDIKDNTDLLIVEQWENVDPIWALSVGTDYILEHDPCNFPVAIILPKPEEV